VQLPSGSLTEIADKRACRPRGRRWAFRDLSDLAPAAAAEKVLSGQQVLPMSKKTIEDPGLVPFSASMLPGGADR